MAVRVKSNLVKRPTTVVLRLTSINDDGWQGGAAGLERCYCIPKVHELLDMLHWRKMGR